MSIVGQTKKFVTTKILPIVTRKQRKLFSFGLQALSLTEYDSLGSNARKIVKNTSTASSKIFRLVRNKTLLSTFPRLVSSCHFVLKTSRVNVDFSTFCGFQTLAFAVQTGKGRALPVWLACLTYPITTAGSQNMFVLEQIKKFGKTLGFYPSFVFDRGFWIPCVIKFLLDHKIIFYLRIKQGQELYWEKTEKKVKAKAIGEQTKDTTIMLFGYRMRLIVSPPPPHQTNPKKAQNTQRWYIVTNDMTSSREEILKGYATRFEVEETFKDYKHIQNLTHLRIKKKETFLTLLWFATVGFWLAWWIEGARDEEVHGKKRRSFVRRFWEGLQRELREVGMREIMGGFSFG